MKQRILVLALGIMCFFAWVKFSSAVTAVTQAQNLGYVNVSISSMSATTIAATSPQSVGNLVFCTNCGTFNGQKGGLCVSTGTAAGAYVGISSLTAVTACN